MDVLAEACLAWFAAHQRRIARLDEMLATLSLERNRDGLLNDDEQQSYHQTFFRLWERWIHHDREDKATVAALAKALREALAEEIRPVQESSPYERLKATVKTQQERRMALAKATTPANVEPPAVTD